MKRVRIIKHTTIYIYQLFLSVCYPHGNLKKMLYLSSKINFDLKK